MSDIVDQPPPKKTNARPSWELVIEFAQSALEGLDPLTRGSMERVIEDMRERDEIGRKRYGTPLQAGNGRRHLIDAYQEKLDYVVYLRTWLYERGFETEESLETLMQNPTIDQVGFVVFGFFMNDVIQLTNLRFLIDQGH